MKKTFLFIITVLSLTGAKAQQDDFFRHKIAVGAGSSYLGVSSKIIAKAVGAASQTSPVYSIDYEYLLDEKIGLGVSLAYQNFYYTVNYQRVNVQAGLSKLNASVGGKFYFANKENSRFFAGLKIGASFWDYNLSLDTVSINNLIDTYFSGIIGSFVKSFVPQNLSTGGKFILQSGMIELGYEKYYTQNFGINAQLAFGSPYWLKIGLSYRFNFSQYVSNTGQHVRRRIF